MMDTDQNADTLSTEEQTYFESGGTIPMPGWEDYPDLFLDGQEEALAACRDAEAADDCLPEENRPEKHERLCSHDPRGDTVIGALDTELDAFSQETPAYDAALRYLAGRRDAELAAFGFTDDRMQDSGFRARQMEGELKQIIAAALANGHNPAAVIYNIACGYGFQADDHGGNMTLKELASMSEQDFGQWYGDNKKTFRKLMGG